MALRLVILTLIVHVLFVQSIECDDDTPCQEKVMVTSTEHIYCNTYHSCYKAFIRQTGRYETYLYDQLAGQDADIESYVVRANSYQAAMGARLHVHAVVASGEKSVQNAIITRDPQWNDDLVVQLTGDRSGYNAQISCSNGETCTITCGGDGSCLETKFYCYTGATCKYTCDSYNVCPELIGGVESDLTDPQIHEIYLRNIANLPKPGQEDYKYNPSKANKYMLSFTSSQFAIFLIANALFVLLPVGLCLWNISTAKNRVNFKNLEKEDWK